MENIFDVIGFEGQKDIDKSNDEIVIKKVPYVAPSYKKILSAIQGQGAVSYPIDNGYTERHFNVRVISTDTGKKLATVRFRDRRMLAYDEGDIPVWIDVTGRPIPNDELFGRAVDELIKGLRKLERVIAKPSRFKTTDITVTPCRSSTGYILYHNMSHVDNLVFYMPYEKIILLGKAYISRLSEVAALTWSFRRAGIRVYVKL